jgi:hypothetical protein
VVNTIDKEVHHVLLFFFGGILLPKTVIIYDHGQLEETIKRRKLTEGLFVKNSGLSQIAGHLDNAEIQYQSTDRPNKVGDLEH